MFPCKYCYSYSSSSIGEITFGIIVLVVSHASSSSLSSILVVLFTYTRCAVSVSDDGIGLADGYYSQYIIVIYRHARFIVLFCFDLSRLVLFCGESASSSSASSSSITPPSFLGEAEFEQQFVGATLTCTVRKLILSEIDKGGKRTRRNDESTDTGHSLIAVR